jgi:predicted transcriptional regulator
LKKYKKPATPANVEERQRLLDIAARADVYEAIRQGEDDIAHGRTLPAEEVFAEFRRRHNLSR